MADHPHPRIVAVGTALPPHYADQEAIVAALREAWGRAHFNVDRLENLHRAVRVKGRYLALPMVAYHELTTFAQCNAAWLEAALDLGEQAVAAALARAGLTPRDVDHLVTVTTTGLATPSLDARLANRLGLRTDVRRTPLFGLGCAGGAGGLARAVDGLRAYPDQVAVLLAAEACSLTLQRQDLSIPNIIASGLFGDGAAAVVLAGSKAEVAAGPAVVASDQVLYPDTERVMGWDVVDTGLKIVLSARVPDVIRAHLAGDVDRFLAAQGHARSVVAHWIIHTGGPRVLDAVAAALELPAGALELSWRSLAEIGNLSSASVLFVLHDLLASGAPRPGDLGVLAAMGPGFATELSLIRW